MSQTSCSSTSKWEVGCLTLFAGFVLVTVGLGWWLFIGSITPPVWFNCRLTLYVATPQGERVGTGVVQFYTDYTSVGERAMLDRAGGKIILGEAVSVDLGAQGHIFVVIANDPDRYDETYGARHFGLPPDPYMRMVTTLFPKARFHGVWPAGKEPKDLAEEKMQWKAYADALKSAKPEAEVPLDELPMIVHFRDMDHHASIERVRPKNFAAVLGKGVMLERATLAITTDPATSGIDALLPWLLKNYPAEVDGRTMDQRQPEENLGSQQFKSYTPPHEAM